MKPSNATKQGPVRLAEMKIFTKPRCALGKHDAPLEGLEQAMEAWKKHHQCCSTQSSISYGPRQLLLLVYRRIPERSASTSFHLRVKAFSFPLLSHFQVFIRYSNPLSYSILSLLSKYHSSIYSPSLSLVSSYYSSSVHRFRTAGTQKHRAGIAQP